MKKFWFHGALICAVAATMAVAAPPKKGGGGGNGGGSTSFEAAYVYWTSKGRSQAIVITDVNADKSAQVYTTKNGLGDLDHALGESKIAFVENGEPALLEYIFANGVAEVDSVTRLAANQGVEAYCITISPDGNSVAYYDGVSGRLSVRRASGTTTYLTIPDVISCDFYADGSGIALAGLDGNEYFVGDIGYDATSGQLSGFQKHVYTSALNQRLESVSTANSGYDLLISWKNGPDGGSLDALQIVEWQPSDGNMLYAATIYAGAEGQYSCNGADILFDDVDGTDTWSEYSPALSSTRPILRGGRRFSPIC